MFGNILQILVNGCHRNMWANITFIIKKHILLRNIWKTLCVKEFEVGDRDRAENLGFMMSAGHWFSARTLSLHPTSPPSWAQLQDKSQMEIPPFSFFNKRNKLGQYIRIITANKSQCMLHGCIFFSYKCSLNEMFCMELECNWWLFNFSNYDSLRKGQVLFVSSCILLHKLK